MSKCELCNKDITLITKIILPCDHAFHRECLNKKKNKKICPVCHVTRENKVIEENMDEKIIIVAPSYNILRISAGLVGYGSYHFS